MDRDRWNRCPWPPETIPVSALRSSNAAEDCSSCSETLLITWVVQNMSSGTVLCTCVSSHLCSWPEQNRETISQHTHTHAYTHAMSYTSHTYTHIMSYTHKPCLTHTHAHHVLYTCTPCLIHTHTHHVLRTHASTVAILKEVLLWGGSCVYTENRVECYEWELLKRSRL